MIDDDNYYVTMQQETTRKLQSGKYEDGFWIHFHDNGSNTDSMVWVPMSEYPASAATAIKSKIADLRSVSNLGTPK